MEYLLEPAFAYPQLPRCETCWLDRLWRDFQTRVWASQAGKNQSDLCSQTFCRPNSVSLQYLNENYYLWRRNSMFWLVCLNLLSRWGRQSLHPQIQVIESNPQCNYWTFCLGVDYLNCRLVVLAGRNLNLKSSFGGVLSHQTSRRRSQTMVDGPWLGLIEFGFVGLIVLMVGERCFLYEWSCECRCQAEVGQGYFTYSSKWNKQLSIIKLN